MPSKCDVSTQSRRQLKADFVKLAIPSEFVLSNLNDLCSSFLNMKKDELNNLLVNAYLFFFLY